MAAWRRPYLPSSIDAASDNLNHAARVGPVAVNDDASRPRWSRAEPSRADAFSPALPSGLAVAYGETMRRLVFGLAVLGSSLLACGGDDDGAVPDGGIRDASAFDGSARPDGAGPLDGGGALDAPVDAGPSICEGPGGSPLVLEVVGASDRTGSVGGVLGEPLEVVLQTEAGAPVEGCDVEWTADDATSGWLFAEARETDGTGTARAYWVGGSGAAQSATARVLVADGEVTAAFDATATPEVTRATSVYLNYDTPSAFDGFHVDLVAETFPPDAYYAALVWDGAYAGIQNRSVAGDEKWIIFSTWDSAGADAMVIDAGGSTCEPFGGEGTGYRCHQTFDWAIGATYRFELHAALAGAGVDYTMTFTDVASGEVRELGTLRYANHALPSYMATFAEDFGPESASCLETAQRTVHLSAQEALTGSAWSPVTGVRFTFVDPRTHCANIDGTPEAPGFDLSTGGERIGNPWAAERIAGP